MVLLSFVVSPWITSGLNTVYHCIVLSRKADLMCSEEMLLRLCWGCVDISFVSVIQGWIIIWWWETHHLKNVCNNVSVHSEKNNRNISVWKNPFGSHLLCVFFWAVLWLPVASRNLSGKFNNLCARVCVFVTEISEESVAVSLVSVGFSVLSRFSVRCVRRCVCRWTQHENLTKSDKFDLQSYEPCCFIVCMFCVRNSNIKRYVSVHDCVSVSLCFLLCVKQQCVCMHVWRTAVASVLTGCSNCSLFSALSKCFKIAHYTLT